MPTQNLVLTHPDGLHARPAAQFVKLAGQFRSSVTVRGNGREANGKASCRWLDAPRRVLDALSTLFEHSRKRVGPPASELARPRTSRSWRAHSASPPCSGACQV